MRHEEHLMVGTLSQRNSSSTHPQSGTQCGVRTWENVVGHGINIAGQSWRHSPSPSQAMVVHASPNSQRRLPHSAGKTRHPDRVALA